ncbi:MAG TPA: cupin domain-containing protein [Gaiellaceae bacterium]|nr:cupin domain-containing protein [Gaiellaceae bacterium]
MVPEAELRNSEQGLVASSDGWFVVNAREVRWRVSSGRAPVTDFEGDLTFPQLGVHLTIVEPGRLATLYHGENAQEDFLVVAGECLLLIEGQERQLRQWDFVHCPPWTEHGFVAIGEERCVLLAIGARPTDDVIYPVSELALRRGVGVEQETTSVETAYASHGRRRPARYEPTRLPED